MTYEPIISVHDSESDFISYLRKLIENISQSSIEKGHNFTIGLSGGSSLEFTLKALNNINSDLSKWRLFFCDERVVPVDDPNSTFGSYIKKLGKIPLKESQFIRINETLNAEDAAVEYTTKLKEYFPDCKWPKFDLLMLGMGPDGHTASLFPDHKLLKENNQWVASIIDSPKPPPSRVTLTLPVINNASNCVFTAAGKDKASNVKKILKDSVQFPARMVQPTNGKLYWILDKAAASEL